MGMFDKVRGIFSPKQINTYNETERALANSFLRNGNRQKPMVQDWSQVIISDKELYSGYSYAAINVRANMFAQLATDNLQTKTKEGLKLPDNKQEHPYLNIINKSKTFTNYQLWYAISTYLDLEGVYYLLAVRNVAGEGENKRIGDIQYFKMMNPYEVRRVIDQTTGDVGGYVETKNGLSRELPKEMVIEIRKLNPFSGNENFAITDAAKEFQYTLKQSGDYTRHALKNNMASPGIISTDVILEPEQFSNFVSRVNNQEKGLPLFGNGAGAITWDPMQIDIDKSSLKNINEINRSTLFAVSGVSKTLMGIEESGTTRETSNVQKELCLENHILPQLQLVVDALNQDYKNNYEKEYDQYEYTLDIDNPIEEDKDIEKKEIENRQSEYELYTALLDSGYDEETASRYVDGEVELSELPKKPEKPEPVLPPESKETPVEPEMPDAKKEEPKKEPKPKNSHNYQSLKTVIKKMNKE